ncbi:FAD-dependent oxidoreductase [Actinocorallia sp. B10E7]|uniref:NAD(P)/FAD-dependent oxidoreductase n=1 Tax=Actinocorallia sp. B10E7 TaxID=3153558 RepID=UPI00325DC027
MVSTYDLIVIGGGIIGCSIAESLRGELSRIKLLDPHVGLELGASSAALGGINPQLGNDCLGPLGNMAQRSRDIFPDWIRGLADKAGQEITILSSGLIQVAADEAEMARLVKEVLPVLRDREIEAHVLDGPRARAHEPLLGPEVAGGLLIPQDLAVEPRRIMSALHRVLDRDPHVELQAATAVEVASTATGATVTLDDGSVLRTERIVVAAGHLSHTLLDLPEGALFPVKGQAMEFAPGVFGRGLSVTCDALIQTPDGPEVAFALPRPDGRIAIGSTFEERVGDTEPTKEGKSSLLRWLARIFPGIDRLPVRRHWAGIRPGSGDGAPVLGHVDEHERILAATGHYGGGITLAPYTARLAAKLLTGASPGAEESLDLKLCDPGRFRHARFGSRSPGPQPTAH